MRKRLLIGLAVVVVLVAGFLLLHGKKRDAATATVKTSARKAVDSLKTKAGTGAKKIASAALGAKGKRGTLKVATAADQAAEKKRQRDEQRRLRQELARRRREERTAARATAARRSRRGGGARSSLNDAYILKGTSPGVYALVGTRRLEKGDVIAGKQLVEIGGDYIVLEQFGIESTVRLGEPVQGGLVTKTRTK